MANELNGLTGIEIYTAVNALVTDVQGRAGEMITKAKELAGIATTAENLAERKKDRAEVNKMVKAIDDERKGIEKGWKGYLAPLSDAYKNACSELNAQVKAIDAGLEEFELARIAEKKAKIKEIFETAEKPSEVADWFTLDEIFQQKWLNVSCTEKQIRKDIDDAFTALKLSYDTVVSLNHKYQAEGLQVLRDTKTLQYAITKMNSLADQERIIEERIRAEEEAKKPEPIPDKKPEVMEASPVPDPVETPADMPFSFENEFPFGMPGVNKYVGIIHATQDQMREICEFLELKGIEYDFEEGL